MDSHDLLLFLLTLISAFAGINFGGTMLLIVPLLLTFGHSPLLVLSSTRPAVIAQSLLGIRMFRSHRDLNARQEVALLISAALGGFTGITMLASLGREQAILLMASLILILVIVAGFKIVLAKTRLPEKKASGKSDNLLVYFLLGFSPAIIGGLVGAGGGPLIAILALLVLKKTPYAIAYLEKFVSLGHSTTVFIWAVFYGVFDLKLSLIMLSATLIGAYTGARVTLKLPAYWMYGIIVLLCVVIIIRQFL